jgi:hypothetical protein
MRNTKRISTTILLLAVSLTGAIVCYASSDPRYRYTIEHHHRQLVEEEEDVTVTPTTATATVFPTTAPIRHSEPPPEEAAERVEEQHKKEEAAVAEISVEYDDGDGDDASESVGKLTAAIDSTATPTLESSHYHGLLSLLFIAICAGFFIAGIPSSITQCHCVENMCSDPNNSDTNHQLHGSVQKRMNTFNRNIMVGRGVENNRARSSITLGEPYSPSGLTSKLTDEEGYELGEEVGIEVDEKRGIDPKPRRPFFGSRLFGALPRTPRGLVRREKKSRQSKEVGTNGAVVSDMYVMAEEEEERQQVEFQKVP